MRLTPAPVPFLGSRVCAHPRAVLIGAPLDATETFRSGTREAPQRVRAVSDVLETYSPQLDRDLEELSLADWGDVECSDGVDASLANIAAAVEQACAISAMPIVVSGEHTATVGA